MKKRFLALLLALSFVATTAATVRANEAQKETAKVKLGTTYNLDEVNKARAELKEEKEVTAIITLKENSKIDFSTLRTEAGKNARLAETKALRSAFKSELDKSGVKYEVVFEYDFLFAGFALKISNKDLKKIENLQGVDTVELSVEYARPQVSKKRGDLRDGTPLTSGIKFRSVDSNELIKLTPALQQTYNGQGRVVAVLDTGIDVNHPILRVSDVSKGMYPNAEAMKAKMQEVGINYGSWRNDKVVYAHNYYSNGENVKENDEASHGMHVSGTAVGNPATPETFVKPDGTKQKELITGVAPEAQLIFMNVFNGKGNTFTHAYAKAVEDSVKLGADSVNLSLGAPNGTESAVGRAMDKAIEFARSMGSLVVIAAGNDGHFGYDKNLPTATNPDYGTVGSPGVAKDALTVAAMNTTVERTNVVTVANVGNLKIGPATLGEGQTKDFLNGAENKDYDYVVVPGVGNPEDFANVDVNGKVAVIQRGAITFARKIVNAQEKGAVGVIIYNHQNGGDDIMGMNYGEEAGLVQIPAVFMGHSDGAKMAATPTGKVTFTKNLAVMPYAHGGTVTDFSSYGYSTDGEFKPDITAPGGLIYSSINNDKYMSMNGTSMATPHVTGAVSIVRKALIDKGVGVKGEAEYDLIKALMMSTADPIFDEGTTNYVSPRKQGAGALNVAKAVSTDVYVVNKADNMAKVSLRNLAEPKVEFTLKVVNFGNKDQTLKYSTVLGTDKVENGLFQLMTETLGTYEGKTVTVPAGGSTDVTISIDASKFHNDLIAKMPNGYFLEGFVFFRDANDNGDVVSIPFSGFKGNWQNLPLWEKPIYDFNLMDSGNPDRTMYAGNLVNGLNANFTALITLERNNFAFDKIWGNGAFNLYGEYNTIPTGFDFASKTFMKDKMAFSPNGDGNKDTVAFKGVFYRNTQYIQANVYKEGETTPVFTSGTGYFAKNSNTQKATSTQSNIVLPTEWFGKDNNGQQLPDGKYKYVVKGNSTVLGSDDQTTEFNVMLDTVAPKVAKPVIENGVYRPEITDELSGVEYAVVVLIVNGQLQYGFPNNGEFAIPQGTDLTQSYIVTYDYAGNITKLMLDGKDFVEAPQPVATTGVRPIFRVTDFRDPDGNIIPNSEKVNMFSREELQKAVQIEYLDQNGNYQVADISKINFVDGNFILPQGKYRMTLLNVPSFYNPVQQNVQEFEVVDGKFTDVVFQTTVNHHQPEANKGEASVRVIIDGKYEDFFNNFVAYVIKDAQGNIVDVDKLQKSERVIVLPVSNEGKVNDIDFKRIPYFSLPEGDYTLEVTNSDTELVLQNKVIPFKIFNGKITPVNIETTEIIRDIVKININGLDELPEGIKVTLVNKATNEVIEVRRSKFNPRSFADFVNDGEYIVKVELPKGYQLDKNNFEIVINNNKVQDTLTISEKVTKVPETAPTVEPLPEISVDEVIKGGIAKEDQEQQIVEEQKDNKPSGQNPGTVNKGKNGTLVKTAHGLGYLEVMSVISLVGLAGASIKRRKK